jgi:hypothetical protein
VASLSNSLLLGGPAGKEAKPCKFSFIHNKKTFIPGKIRWFSANICFGASLSDSLLLGGPASKEEKPCKVYFIHH